MEIHTIPLRDQIYPFANIRLRTYFIVNARLDRIHLKAALDRLIRHHWRLLGGRLVQRQDDKRWECHVPIRFEDDYEIVRYTDEERPETLEQTLPDLNAKHPKNKVTLLPEIRKLEEVISPAVWPTARKEEPLDAPLLWVHVRTLADATIVGLNCNHVIADLGGVSNIVRGQVPPPMMNLAEDPLKPERAYSELPKELTSRKGYLRWKPWWEFLYVLIPVILELIMRRRESRHVVFFPLELVEKLRVRCNKEIEAKEGINPALSHGDVISAVLFKVRGWTSQSISMVADCGSSQEHTTNRHIKPPSARPLTVSNNLNRETLLACRLVLMTPFKPVRGRMPQLTPEQSTSWIYNSQHYTVATFDYSPSTTRLSEIASHVRRSIKTGLEPENVQVGLATREEMTRRGQGIQYFEAWTTSIHVSNWTGALRDMGVQETVSEMVGTPEEDVDVMCLGSGRPQSHSHRCKSRCRPRVGQAADLF
jgi:hypothetical protein